MKTFRILGMALSAVLMCVNFASCSSSDDDPAEEKNEGGVVTTGKKITKIVGKSESTTDSETYTFSYDSKGRLISAIETEEEDGYKYTDTYQLTWGDDAIKIIETSTRGSSTGYDYSSTETYTLTLKNGLVQYEDYEDDGDRGTYTYNSSNRLIKFSDGDEWTNTAIWDGDKLVSISDYDDNATLTYGTSCKKGYFPFIAAMIGAGECNVLFMAHPEIAGMRTTQLPTSVTWTYDNYSGTESETSTFAYEFDKDGYISKITVKKYLTYTYTLTWE